MNTQVELPQTGLYYTDDSRVFEIDNMKSILKFECSDCGRRIGVDLLGKDVYVCPDCNSRDIEGVIEYWSISPQTLRSIERYPLQENLL